MAVVNRDLDPSSQVRVEHFHFSAVATGVTSLVAVVPNACQVVSAGVRAYGLSGAPVYSLNILRATTAGPTLLGLGATVAPAAAAGLSGAVAGVSITLGATQALQAGDVLVLNSGVANTAAAQLLLTVAFKPLQDVQTYFGVAPV